MLRKAARSVLMAADLDPYHADLDPRTKQFKLYTPCGKTFAIVSGVLFSSLKPTKEEIEYAIELLEFWLVRNKAIIDTYIAAFTKLQMYGELDTVRDNMEVKISTTYSHTLGKHITTSYVSVTHEEIIYSINPNGYFTSIFWNKPIAVTTSLKLPAAMINIAVAFLDEHQDCHIAKKTVNDILAEMNTCKDL